MQLLYYLLKVSRRPLHVHYLPCRPNPVNQAGSQQQPVEPNRVHSLYMSVAFFTPAPSWLQLQNPVQTWKDTVASLSSAKPCWNILPSPVPVVCFVWVGQSHAHQDTGQRFVSLQSWPLQLRESSLGLHIENEPACLVFFTQMSEQNLSTFTLFASGVQ